MFSDPIEHELPPSAQASADKAVLMERRFAFAIDVESKHIVFADGALLKGANYRLFARLLVQFKEDLDAGRAPQDFGFISVEKLEEDLSVEEHALRQRVVRIRRDLQQQFAARIGYSIDEQDIIQTSRSKGYRLNPYLLLDERNQIIRLHAKVGAIPA